MINWTAIAAVIGSIATVAGSYGGYWLAGRNEEQRDRRADAREATGRRAALADRLKEDGTPSSATPCSSSRTSCWNWPGSGRWC